MTMILLRKYFWALWTAHVDIKYRLTGLIKTKVADVEEILKNVWQVKKRKAYRQMGITQTKPIKLKQALCHHHPLKV